jgi:hypothetical protein
MTRPPIDFPHRHAAHCESGVVANLLTHQGVPLSEPMAFGLSATLAFAYLPFVRIQEMPMIAYRLPPGAIIRGVARALGVRFAVEKFRSPEAGQARLDALLEAGCAVGAQASVYWLGYCPEDMRFHFNAHNLVVYGREGDQYLISDPVIEHPVRCSRAELSRARFARGLLAPHGLLYHAEAAPARPIDRKMVDRAIRRTVRIMRAPLPLVGVRGMRALARKLARLDAAERDTQRLVGHVVRMQEEIGTGGAGFRFLYAAFLQEAAEAAGRPELAGFAERLLGIGDDWRAFALRAARMVKGRDPYDLAALAELLRQQAAAEDAFFRDLGASLS